jgi:iron(III) transport system ATP-binding protein
MNIMEIRIQGVSKYYFSGGKTIKALDNVDLIIPANQIFTLLGPSGCGKTTLLRCIVGLETPDKGEISIGDEIVWSKEKNISIPTEKRGLGMVFQTYAIWPHMNVFDNVAYPLQIRNVPRSVIRQRVAKTLGFVHLEGMEKRPATKLSGGQQQRVALARALVAEPKVILFDEPLSNLDAKLREETRKDLRAFLSTLKITAVYVTHDRVEALSLSDTIAIMREGRISSAGPTWSRPRYGPRKQTAPSWIADWEPSPASGATSPRAARSRFASGQSLYSSLGARQAAPTWSMAVSRP